MQKMLFIYGPLNAGGAERVLLDFLSNLDRKKYDISLCLMIDGGTLAHEIPKDIKTFALWTDYNLNYKLAYRTSIWFGNDYLFKRVLHKKIKDEYDVIISFLEGMPLKLHSLLLYNSKNITWVHADLDKHRYSQNSFYKKREQEAYEKMDTVVCVSKDTEKAFLRRFQNFKKPTLSIYNPIDNLKIQTLSKAFVVEKSEKFKIVLVGRLTEPKRIDRALRVAALCKSEKLNIQFQIVGDGEFRDELKKMVADLDINDYVEFVGYQNNPYPYIKEADVLLSSSAYEGFGLVLCEAMCLGVPAIATKTAGPSEIIGDNRYGLLCEHDDKAIFEAIKELCNNIDLQKHYKEMGLKRALDFSVTNAMEQFDQMIDGK